jgi:hypothetical protein
VSWAPAKIYEIVQDPLGTSTAPLVVTTDAGRAYAKVMGNPEGPSALACDLLGTRFASWLGLPVFDAVVLELPAELAVDLGRGCRAQPGPALLTRAVIGRSWDGGAEDLQLIRNPEALAGMVVLDTWLRNLDRFCERARRRNLGNVFLSEEDPSGIDMLAIDHTECIRCGRELTLRQMHIDQEREAELYGLFPEFVPHVTRERAERYGTRLAACQEAVADMVLSEIPVAWLDASVRPELPGFCARRARHVSSHIMDWLARACPWQNLQGSRS